MTDAPHGCTPIAASGPRSPGAFSLVEIVTMVVLLMILTGSGAVYYRQVTEEGRWQVAERDLKFLAGALRIHAIRFPHDRPSSLSDLKDLDPGSLDDPWGNAYVLVPGERIGVASPGPDHAFDEDGTPQPDDLYVWIDAAPPVSRSPPPSPEGADPAAGPAVPLCYRLDWIAPVPGERRPDLPPAGGAAPGGPCGRTGAVPGGAPSLYAAVVATRSPLPGEDPLPDDRLMALVADVRVRMQLIRPEGALDLTVTPDGALPGAACESYAARLTSGGRSLRPRPEGWVLTGSPDEPASALRFFRATPESLLCSGSYEARATVRLGDGPGSLEVQGCRFTLTGSDRIGLVWTDPAAGSTVGAGLMTVTVELALDPGVAATLAVSGGGGQIEGAHGEIHVDGQPALASAPPVSPAPGRLRLAFRGLSPAPPGLRRIRLTFGYRDLMEAGRPHELCHDWTVFVQP